MQTFKALFADFLPFFIELSTLNSHKKCVHRKYYMGNNASYSVQQ